MSIVPPKAGSLASDRSHYISSSFHILLSPILDVVPFLARRFNIPSTVNSVAIIHGFMRILLKNKYLHYVFLISLLWKSGCITAPFGERTDNFKVPI